MTVRYLLVVFLVVACSGDPNPGEPAAPDTSTTGDAPGAPDAPDAGAPEPVAVIEPSLLSFGAVETGQTVTKAFQLANVGQAPLEIAQMALGEASDFALALDGEPPLTVDPGQSIEVMVEYTPKSSSCAVGTVTIHTNDPNLDVGSVALAGGHCDSPSGIEPTEIDFGGALVGMKKEQAVQITAAGSAALVVTGASFAEGSSPAFAIELETPLTVEAGATATFDVVYLPHQVSPFDETGLPIPHTGRLVLETNDPTREYAVDVSGFGVAQECPVAVGTIQEGDVVIPQTRLHLVGDQSFAPAGAIASWTWSVEQPEGSASVFIPSAHFPNPTFEVNVAGEYTFRLDVYDENGTKSCVPWEQTVMVIPDQAIHVELLWHTPDDPDESDEGPQAGSDLDLHFAHTALADSKFDGDGDGVSDYWFDTAFDCFWFNPHPNWGDLDPGLDDDPGLDRDDTDGAGPENLNLAHPEQTTYAIGVHYWEPNGYGDAFATVRVYFHGELVFEVKDVKLTEHALWYVADIDWAAGTIPGPEGRRPPHHSRLRELRLQTRGTLTRGVSRG